MLSGNDMFRLSTRMKKAEEIASELIVKEIEEYIKKCAEDGHLFCEVEVPVIQAGAPHYEYEVVVNMVCSHFKNNDFKVDMERLGILKLDWNHNEDNPESIPVRLVYAPQKE